MMPNDTSFTHHKPGFNHNAKRETTIVVGFVDDGTVKANTDKDVQ